MSAKFPSKSALRDQRRRESERQWDEQRRAEAAEREEARETHFHVHSEVMLALSNLGIDPRQLRDCLKEMPE